MVQAVLAQKNKDSNVELLEIVALLTGETLSSLKCAQCGLINFASETTCKRCGAALNHNLPRVVSPRPQGIVLEDGYVLPPPPTVGMPGSGAWRDKSTLVMSQGAALPDRCIKCNEPAHGLRLKRKLTWHHPAIYLLIFVALLIYLVVALILRKRATVEIGLCERHLAKRRKNILITWLVFSLGVAGLIMAAVAEDGTYLLVGAILLLGAIIYGLVVVRVVVPSKIDDKFVWLRGVNKNYLDLLPQWPGA